MEIGLDLEPPKTTLNDYTYLEENVLNLKYVKNLFERVSNSSTEILVDFDVIRDVFPPGFNLHQPFHNLRVELEKTDTQFTLIKQINEQNLFSILYIFLLEDAEEYQIEISLEALHLIILFSNLLYKNEAHEKIYLFNRLYPLILSKILILLKKHGVPSSALFKLNDFLKYQDLPLTLLKRTIDFLFEFIKVHFNMIQSLNMFSERDSNGFLAFVCLSTLLRKKYDQTAKRKHEIIFHIFSAFEEHSQPNVFLSNVEHGTLQSNFRSFVRQVSPHLTQEFQEITIALVHLSKKYSDSKSLVLLLDQFPYQTYERVVDVLIKTAKRKYNKLRQRFCMNLLESPYIFDNFNNNRNHLTLMEHMVEAIIWPIKLKNLEIIKNTLVVFDRVLKIADENVQFVLSEKLKKDKNFNSFNILNYIYQFCTEAWTSKITNQYFVKIFCQIYVATEIINMNNYEQFKRLIRAADGIDLIPCLPELLKAVKLLDNDICRLICETLANNATSPSTCSKHYVQAMYEMLFINLPDSTIGIDIAAAMFGYEINMRALLLKMISMKLIKITLIDTICELLISKVHGWAILEIIMPEFPPSPLSLYVPNYWAIFRNVEFWKREEATCFFSTLCRCLKLKKNLESFEVSFIQNVIDFVDNQIHMKTVNTRSLQAALIFIKLASKKIKYKENSLLIFYRECELLVTHASGIILRSGKIKDSRILTRDFAYFGEIHTIYMDVALFKPNLDTLKNLQGSLEKMSTDCINDYPDYASAIIKCCTKLSNRDKNFESNLINKLMSLMQLENPKIQLVCLNCLYDLTLSKRFNAVDLEIYIIRFVESYDCILKVQSLTIFMHMVINGYTMLTDWQLYLILYCCMEQIVEKLIDKSIVAKFYDYSVKFFEKYFVNIILYFNNFYDSSAKYTIASDVLPLVPQKAIPIDTKRALYKRILFRLSISKRHKIVIEMYKELDYIFRNINNSYPQNHELLQDVMMVTLMVLKQTKRDFPLNHQQIYENAIKDIQELKKPAHVANQTNKEILVAIKSTLSSLIKILAIIDYKGVCVVPELIYLILAIIYWYYDQIKTILSEEGNSSYFKTELLKIPELYEANKSFLHFEEVQNLNEESSRSEHIYCRR